MARFPQITQSEVVAPLSDWVTLHPLRTSQEVGETQVAVEPLIQGVVAAGETQVAEVVVAAAEVVVEATKLNNLQLAAQIEVHFANLASRGKLSFLTRLSRENNWTWNYTVRAYEEYKKFILLLALTPHTLTPSDEVDQVWHLHLQYSRDYQTLCSLIGKFIHHEPTSGGKAEDEKYDRQYEKTKKIYTEFFNQSPPSDIWDAAESRFFHKPQAMRINFQDNFIISYKKVPYLIAALVLIGIGLGLALSILF